MRKAKVLYRMKDRAEYTYAVEGEGQREWLQAGEKLLVAELGIKDKLFGLGAVIESFQTIPEDALPGEDKADGIAIRSPLQKLRMDLIPAAAMAVVARVFTFGAANYGDQNWRNGFSFSRCVGAAERHFTKWKMGEDFDSESGLNHLAHDIVNKLFLLEFQILGLGMDDRIKYSRETIENLMQASATIDNK